MIFVKNKYFKIKILQGKNTGQDGMRLVLFNLRTAPCKLQTAY